MYAAAISMTLCELRTAGIHSIPLECEEFLEERGSGDRVLHGICVEWASLLEISDLFTQLPQGTFQEYSVLGQLFWVSA
jgi:hypothetical protein